MKKVLGILAGLIVCAALILFSIIFGMQQSSPSIAPEDVQNTSGQNIEMYDAPMAMYEVESDAMVFMPDYTTLDFNTEEYSSFNENRFLSTNTSPLSTFSADVDTASYANIRRYITDGELPQPGSVRVEEMINYFKFDYPEPKDGEPFSVTTEISDCPWNEDAKLMLIGLQAAEPEFSEENKSNLVFLIDVSGSMDSADKLPLVKRAFLLLAEGLSENDRVSIVTYASSDAILLEGVSGDEKDSIMSAIEGLTAGGATAGADGINTAYDLAEQYFIEDGNNRVILATDGDLNVGVSSEGELTRLIEEKRESGVFLSVLGFGTDNIKDNKMEALADNGNGNYHYIDNIFEARKVMVEEAGGTFFTVAKDVKFQVDFNPAYIKGYRLIGYETRLLEDEDFADDTKDAGEIGAGHRVTVLYELIDADSDYEISDTGSKYQDTSEGSPDTDEWLTVNIRYKEPDGDTSKLLSYPVTEDAYSETPSDDLLFAAAVAETGMLLSESDYSGTTSYDMILEQLDEIEDLEDDIYKDEFKFLVRRAKSL